MQEVVAPVQAIYLLTILIQLAGSASGYGKYYIIFTLCSFLFVFPTLQ